MSTIDKPPKLNLELMTYDFWKKQISSWKITTDITDKKKWGHLLILHSVDQKIQEEEVHINLSELADNL